MGRVWGPGMLGVAVLLLALMLLPGQAQGDTMAAASKSWSVLDMGQDAVFTPDQSGMPITEIRFSLIELTQNVYLELDVLSSNDTLIEARAPGQVYSYIRVTPTNIQAFNINSIFLRFRVEDTWISGNNINRNTISLYKYDSGWTSLETTLLEAMSSGGYTYYHVPLDRFSLFAVSGEALAPEQACSPREQECRENNLYRCSQDGMYWEVQEACEYGCLDRECRPEPSCPDPGTGLCSPGEQKCSGNELQQCTMEGTGWESVRECPGGCIACQEGPVPCDFLPYQLAIIALIIIVIMITLYSRLHK